MRQTGGRRETALHLHKGGVVDLGLQQSSGLPEQDRRDDRHDKRDVRKPSHYGADVFPRLSPTCTSGSVAHV